MVAKAILWDFDGTLAYRRSSWSDCLLELLDIHHPDHGHPIEEIRPLLPTGFPWHDHGSPHESPGDPDEWWRQVTELKTLDEWRPAEDAIPVLTELRESGWAHFVLSNHVPELEQVVNHIGLGDLVEATVSSGVIGYEKPHAEAFRIALDVAGNP